MIHLHQRRTFLKQAGILLGSSLWAPMACASPSSLHVLVLGGTYFLGPAIVQSLLDKGHRVTLFNRGKTNPHLFPELPKIRGDRELGLSAYEAIPPGKHWDVVIDVWPQHPKYVEEAVLAVKDRCDHYIYVSSIAVYRDYRTTGITEEHPLVPGEQFEEDNYSLNKKLCEEIVAQHFPGKFTVLRPGAIVGERDPGPFTHHLIRRFDQQSEVLAPDADDPVQIIDAWDIGNFVAHCAAQQNRGYYNLVGPTHTLSYRKMLERLRAHLPVSSSTVWVEPDFLTREMKLEPFVDIPFWIPTTQDPEPGFYQISNRKALEHGLVFSNPADTIRRAYQSYKAGHTPSDDYLRGISMEQETAVLKAWQERI